jgi:hypothetical protein
MLWVPHVSLLLRDVGYTSAHLFTRRIPLRLDLLHMPFEQPLA